MILQQSMLPSHICNHFSLDLTIWEIDSACKLNMLPILTEGIALSSLHSKCTLKFFTSGKHMFKLKSIHILSNLHKEKMKKF